MATAYPGHGSPDWDSPLKSYIDSKIADKSPTDAEVADKIENGALTTQALNTQIAAVVEPVAEGIPAQVGEAVTASAVGRRTLLALGNSITNMWATGGRFSVKLSAFVGALGGSLTLINAGVGGNTSAQQLARLPGLLADHSPTWCTIVPSVNDRKTGGVSPAVTLANVKKMVGICRWAGVQPVLMTDPPLNPVVATVTDPTFVAASEYDRRACNALIRAYATAAGIILADVDACFSSNDVAASGDGIHPTGNTLDGVNGLDAICVTLARALLSDTTTVYGWPHVRKNVVYSDEFARADDATTLGAPWVAESGTRGIASGRAYCASGGTWNVASVDALVADHAAVATGVGTTGVAYEVSLATRLGSSGGYYLAELDVASARTAALKLFRIAGTTPTQIGATVTVPSPLADAAELELASVGNAHTVRVNGMTLIQATDATYPTGTRAGMHQLGNPKFERAAVYA